MREDSARKVERSVGGPSNSTIVRACSPSLPPQPEWAEVEGVQVLRILERHIVAAPNSGRRNARRFDVIDLSKRKWLCQLPRREVTTWLIREYRAAAEPPLKPSGRGGKAKRQKQDGSRQLRLFQQ